MDNDTLSISDRDGSSRADHRKCAELHGGQRDSKNAEGNPIVYSPLAADCELSSKADCSETLRADWHAAHPDDKTRIEELEELVAELLYGGEDE